MAYLPWWRVVKRTWGDGRVEYRAERNEGRAAAGAEDWIQRYDHATEAGARAYVEAAIADERLRSFVDEVLP